ncbi:MAG TPA: nitrate- and nitrite sensing domain-containing protein [Streptosporangiaceae bacterium]|nr:nitrate- and nitrite sensing domain-containing protein [Streptosporangiaceae bacterium]
MAGLLAYAAGTSISNAIDLDRVPNLINAAGVPAAKFGLVLQNERTAAVVYLFAPDAGNLAAYQQAVSATDKATPGFTTSMASHQVLGSESPAGARQIQVILGGLKELPTLRKGVQARALTPLEALGAYNQGPAATIKLFLIQTNTVTPTSQHSPAIGLIDTVQAREQLSQETALLAGMLAGHRETAADRVAFANMVGARQTQLQDVDNLLDAPSLAAWNAANAGSKAALQQLAGIEQAVVAGTPVTKLPVTQEQWQGITGPLMKANFNGGIAVSQEIITADQKIAHAAWVRVALVSGGGLLGLLITIVVTTLVARSIIRRLRGLETNALQLAEVQLPDVVGRLRRGEDVDVNAEAPALRVGRDEIGRVGQAFDLVRQTAIRAAVDEARLRQGLNDVFRSLARRSQSLLHRQLTLLDQMERRASDPEALDDLFRLDHLTTRMRRHAEGLVILAGAPPGRGWSSPVRMVDVMRGAIAEVEDYARVSVATRSQAALAGSAVADVIHLLAELIENATTLSPPYTSVRVSGDTVANGFAIEVEDRGLGMNPARLAELNDRLANPPEFNPSDSEQLGLFVVSQLAKRHGVRVTLKASPYGGTAAIVLIPSHLVVTEEAFRAGLPGEPAAAQLTANGHHALPDPDGLGLPGAPGPGLAEINGGALAGNALSGGALAGPAPGVRISGALRRSQGSIPERPERGAHAAPPPALAPADGINGTNGSHPGDLPRRHHDPSATPPQGTQPNGTAPHRAMPGGPVADGPIPGGPVPGGPVPGGTVPGIVIPDGMGASAFDVFTPRRPAQPGTTPYPDPGTAPTPGAAPFAGAGPGPVPPGGDAPSFPGAGQASYPDQPAPFPGWTVRNPPTAPGGRGASGPAGPATPMTPVASSRPAQAPGPPWEISRETGPLPAAPGGPGPEAGGASDIKGLPRRVRQANLAPQLRDSPPQRRTTVASAGLAGGSTGPSPAEIRQTMSSLQRGWQEGRAQMASQPPETSPAGGEDSTASEETRGDSDGS